MTNTERHTDEEINNWPASSYYGRERDFCDLLTMDCMDWFYTTTEFFESDDLEREAFLLFTLLMMNEPAFLALTIDEPGRLELRQSIQDDANDDSGTGFRLRLAQRLRSYRELIRLARPFKTYNEENMP